MEQSNNEAMIYLFLLFFEIIFLFFLSRSISKNLSRFLPIPVLSLIFFPGTVVHELSHLLTASILFVRVGEVEFSPKIIDGGLKLGSVEIAKTDPIRRAIIGFAPVLVGLLIILGIVYFLFPFLSFWGSLETPESLLILGITLYLLFVISNTMFSSAKDMEGTIELLVVLLVFFTAFYLIGFRFPDAFIESLFSKEVTGLIQKSSIFLLAPIVIDFVILGGIRVIRK